MGRLALLALGVVAVAAVAWWATGRGAADDLSAVVAEVRQEFPEVPRWSVEELDRRLEAGEDPLLLDTRAAEEYAVSHLPGAVHAETADDIRQAVAAADRSRPVVLYCSVGYRSARLAERLRDEVDRPLVNLEGSIFAWANSGRPVVRDGREVGKVHPYDARWGRLLDPELRATP